MRFMILFFVTLGFSFSAMAQDAAPSGEIAFASNREAGINQIYLMNADGSNVRQLTTGEYDNFVPVWSPDGQKIAFMLDTGEQNGSDALYALWVMDADGKNAVEIVRPEEASFIANIAVWMSWSPDSKRLLYRHYFSEDKIDLILVKADGTERQTLTPDVKQLHQAYFLTNDSLVITDYDSELGDVLRYDLEDGAITPLSEYGIPVMPSHDGTQLAVIEKQSLELVDLSTGERRVLQEILTGLEPDEEAVIVYALYWSADGSHITGMMNAYAPANEHLPHGSNRDLLFVTRADGRDYAVFEGTNGIFSISPDGEYVTFGILDEADKFQIVIARADGQEEPIIITTEGQNSQPAWRPVP